MIDGKKLVKIENNGLLHTFTLKNGEQIKFNLPAPCRMPTLKESFEYIDPSKEGIKIIVDVKTNFLKEIVKSLGIPERYLHGEYGSAESVKSVAKETKP